MKHSLEESQSLDKSNLAPKLLKKQTIDVLLRKNTMDPKDLLGIGIEDSDDLAKITKA